MDLHKEPRSQSNNKFGMLETDEYFKIRCIKFSTSKCYRNDADNNYINAENIPQCWWTYAWWNTVQPRATVTNT